MNLLKRIWKVLKPRTQAQAEHDWLSQSHDLAELERRQRILTNKNLKGWV